MERPATSRTTVAALAVLAFAFSVTAEDTSQASKPIWITVVQQPGEESEFRIQISSGAEFTLVETVADALEISDPQSIRLLVAKELNLTLRSDTFLAIRILDKKVTLAPSAQFPFLVTRKMVQQLRGLGFDSATVCTPDQLLPRTKSSGPLTLSPSIRGRHFSSTPNPVDFTKYFPRDPGR